MASGHSEALAPTAHSQDHRSPASSAAAMSGTSLPHPFFSYDTSQHCQCVTNKDIYQLELPRDEGLPRDWPSSPIPHLEPKPARKNHSDSGAGVQEAMWQDHQWADWTLDPVAPLAAWASTQACVCLLPPVPRPLSTGQWFGKLAKR